MPDDLRDQFVALMEEVFNRGNHAAAAPLVADDFFNHESPDSRGPEGFTATARWLRSAFPDYHAQLHEFLIDGDLLAARLTVTGTHAGEFMGVAPTGRSFSVQHMHMYRVRDGKLVEHWACRDDLGQLRQLGLLPGPSGDR
jgi:steroid delta-isomerase-like uncharacterized protein